MRNQKSVIDVSGHIVTLPFGQDDLVHAYALFGLVDIEGRPAGPGDMQRQLHDAVSWAGQVLES